MPRKQNILVIADANPDTLHTLATAKLMAEALEAHLTIVGLDLADRPDEDFEARLTGTVKRAMADFTDFEVAFEVGANIAGHVVQRCNDGTVDLIIKSGNRTETMFYSPIDWHLIRDTKTAVLLLGKDAGSTGFKTVVATLDINAETPEQRTLDRRVLDHAANIAQTFDATLHGAVCIQTSQVLSDLDLVNLHKRERAHAPRVKQIIKDDYSDYPVEDKNWHVHAGVPEKVLAGIAKGIKADLVVVGSVGRKKLQGLLIGNTVEKLLTRLDTNVLVVKPD